MGISCPRSTMSNPNPLSYVTQPIGKKEDECSSCSSSTGDDDDQNWDDWGSDSLEKQECPSLFDDTVLPSAVEVLAYDKKKFGFDLDHICNILGGQKPIFFSAVRTN
jgi:protein arginine N-methyltransferase 3